MYRYILIHMGSTERHTEVLSDAQRHALYLADMSKATTVQRCWSITDKSRFCWTPEDVNTLVRELATLRMLADTGGAARALTLLAYRLRGN
jgi:hypothetical protein